MSRFALPHQLVGLLVQLCERKESAQKMSGARHPPSCLPRTFFYKAWNYSAAKALQDQHQLNRPGNLTETNSFIPAILVNMYFWDMSLQSTQTTSINVRKISPSIKAQNAAISKEINNFAKFRESQLPSERPPPILY